MLGLLMPYRTTPQTPIAVVPDTFSVRVGWRDLFWGTPNSFDNCPIVRALRRYCGARDIWVIAKGTHINGDSFRHDGIALVRRVDSSRFSWPTTVTFTRL